MKLVLIFMFTSVCCFSQSSFGNKKNNEPIILTSSDFKKGMYSSFDDFLKGQPFVSGWKFDTLLYQIRDAISCKTEIGWREASYDDKDPFYPCKKSEDKLKNVLFEQSKIQLDAVWGFNDGHFIYCRLADNFYPVLSVGRYAVINLYNSNKPSRLNTTDYEKIDAKINSPYLDAQDYASKEFAKDIAYPAVGFYGNKMKLFLLSMETGNILKFTEDVLTEILKKDEELYNQYLNIKHTEENNNLFLSKFNQKYPFEF